MYVAIGSSERGTAVFTLDHALQLSLVHHFGPSPQGVSPVVSAIVPLGYE